MSDNRYYVKYDSISTQLRALRLRLHFENNAAPGATRSPGHARAVQIALFVHGKHIVVRKTAILPP
jgi:hypothetical protein